LSEYFPANPATTVTFPDVWPAKIDADPALADGVPLPPAAAGE